MQLPEKILKEFITRNKLPDAFSAIAMDYYLPLAEWAARACAECPHSVIGINGAPGTGKSTLAGYLRLVLSTSHGMRVVVLSIDDIYLTRNQRQKLGREVHPLLDTRGVPGTHDIELGGRVMDSLLEGWCIGSAAQHPDELKEPVNELEAIRDEDGQWRDYVNRQLAYEYKDFFARLNKLIFLQVPDLDSVRLWRLEQEEKLLAGAVPGRKPHAMTSDQVRHFVAYFERITRANLVYLPGIADVVVRLNRDHQVQEIIYK
jgi:D-glycerate 3-kinase